MNKHIVLETKMDLNAQISYCLLMSNIIANLDINKKDKEILLLLLQDIENIKGFKKGMQKNVFI